MGKREGEIGLVTGGNSDIGLATAKLFVQECAYVFITGRRGREPTEGVRTRGTNVTGVQGDVSKLGDLDRFFAQIKSDKGRLGIVVANGGIGCIAPLGDVNDAIFDLVFAVDVKGLLFSVQEALPLMPDESSTILSSFYVASNGWAVNNVYSAMKAAVRS